MDEAKVMEVLRRVEWAWSAPGGFCPCCYQLKSDGHAENCKLDALLSEGRGEKAETEDPVWLTALVNRARVEAKGREQREGWQVLPEEYLARPEARMACLEAGWRGKKR